MHSIRKRIMTLTFAWVAVILLAGQIAVDIVADLWLVEQYDEALITKARALATLTKFDGSKVELDFADEFMPEFESKEQPQYFILFLEDGTLVERSNSYDGYSASVLKRQQREVVTTDIDLPDGRSGRQVTIRFAPQIEDRELRIQIPAADRPTAIIQVSRERETLNLKLIELDTLIFGISAVVLLTILVTSKRAIDTGLKPLMKIKNEISRITPSSIAIRVDTEGKPIELQPIARQFNLALTEIEKALQRERQFSSDVAHELRTPVAEIRALAEVGMRWPDEKDIRSYFTDIHESSRHLDHLIENLLHLCRSEEGKVELEIGEIGLQTLIDKVLSALADDANSKKVSFAMAKSRLPTLLTDAKWVEVILVNLISNAIAYSPPGSEVSIEVVTGTKDCTIKINNPMEIRLTEDDLKKIFRRFWRKDAARKSGEHAGIGLSLLKSYADYMNLKVHASIAGNLFNISIAGLPLAPSPAR